MSRWSAYIADELHPGIENSTDGGVQRPFGMCNCPGGYLAVLLQRRRIRHISQAGLHGFLVKRRTTAPTPGGDSVCICSCLFHGRTGLSCLCGRHRILTVPGPGHEFPWPARPKNQVSVGKLLRPIRWESLLALSFILRIVDVNIDAGLGQPKITNVSKSQVL
jgi:hypothetical protein